MTHHLPDGHTARSATSDDAKRVANLVNDQSECAGRGRPATPERMLQHWDHPKFDPVTDSRLVFAPDGALIGFARIRDVKDPPVDVFGGFVVHPDHNEASWLWDDLFGWMEAEARRVIPKAPADARIALVAGAPESDMTELRELERHGFDHSRTFHLMQVDFTTESSARREEPGRWPEGIGVRELTPGKDDEALVPAWCEAFANHYGIVKQPFETELEEWRRLMREDGFDPTLWFLATTATMTPSSVCASATPPPPETRIGRRSAMSAFAPRGVGAASVEHCSFTRSALLPSVGSRALC